MTTGRRHRTPYAAWLQSVRRNPPCPSVIERIELAVMVPNGFNRYRLSVFVPLKTTVSRASWSGACGSVEVIDHGSKGNLNHLEQVVYDRRHDGIPSTLFSSSCGRPDDRFDIALVSNTVDPNQAESKTSKPHNPFNQTPSARCQLGSQKGFLAE